MLVNHAIDNPAHYIGWPIAAIAKHGSRRNYFCTEVGDKSHHRFYITFAGTKAQDLHNILDLLSIAKTLNKTIYISKI